MSISVNTMRAIDHWVGVPLCALVSPLVALVDRIKSLFTPTLEAPKKLLFIELSEMGSAIWWTQRCVMLKLVVQSYFS